MTGAVKFFFDECLPRPIVENQLSDSLRLFGASADVLHLFSRFQPGTKDETWIEHIATEGGWVVITADGGKKSKKSEKLPLICRSHLVTHVILSARLHAKKSHDKFLAIAGCWEELINMATSPRGTGYLMRLTNSGAVKIEKVYDPSEGVGPSRQKDLFY